MTRVTGTARITRLGGIYVLLVATFVLALTAVYALPQQSIPSHLTESVAQLRAETPFPLVRTRAYMLDDYTDALMLDTTFRQASDSPLFAAMASTKELSASGSTVDALAQTATGVRSKPSHYSYYWSGYQVVLRPLVILFNYAQIRLINLIALLLLSGLVLFVLGAVIGWKGVASFAAALLACGFFIVPLSLQYSNMTYLMLLSMLAVLFALKRRSFERFDWEIFFVVGMLAAFFDLLTAPLLTLGIPLAIALIARSKSSSRSRLQFQLAYAATASGLWGLGYVTSWGAKWVIGQAALREDVWGSAVKQIFFRAGLSDQGASRGQAIFATFFQLFPMSLAGSLRVGEALGMSVLAVLAIVVLGFLVLRRAHPTLDRDAAVLLVIPLPYLWYLVASNHSLAHMAFTYRIQAIAVFALFYVALCMSEAIFNVAT